MNVLRELTKVIFSLVIILLSAREALADSLEYPFSSPDEALRIIKKHEDANIHELHRQLTDERFTCYQFVYAAFLRIHSFDLNSRHLAPINAFTYLNEKALTEAKALDNYLKKHGVLKGPLHCVTVALKDSIAVTEFPINGGSRAMLGSTARKNAVVVDRLQQAGAVIVGLTAMDEFGRGVSGVSGLSGRTGNPFAPDYSMGGSSSGAAASAAAGFSMIGVGTDNCGSLTIPASYGGLATIRSTLGVLPQDGIIPANPADQVVGPITRTASDLKIVFNVLRGTHEDGAQRQSLPTQNAPKHYKVSILESYGDTATKKETFSPYLNEILSPDTIVETALHRLTDGGHGIAEKASLKNFSLNRYFVGRASALDEFLEEYSSYEGGYVSICSSEDTSAFYRRSFLRCAASRFKSLFLNDFRSSYDEDRLASYKENAEAIRKALEGVQADALMFPADAKGHAQIFEKDINANCLLMTTSGAPAVTVYFGQVDVDNVDLPLSMVFLGNVGEDDMLIDLSVEFSELMPKWTPPNLGVPDADFMLGSSWFDEQNSLRRALGLITFNSILKDGKKEDLTAGRSRDALVKAKLTPF